MKNIIRISTWTGCILLIPLLLTLLAIWHWKLGAFVLAFVLLAGGAGLIYQLISKKLLSNKTYGLAVGSAMLPALLLVWMNAAVGGILGDNPANMMYFGVLLIGCAALLSHSWNHRECSAQCLQRRLLYCWCLLLRGSSERLLLIMVFWEC